MASYWQAIALYAFWFLFLCLGARVLIHRTHELSHSHARACLASMDDPQRRE